MAQSDQQPDQRTPKSCNLSLAPAKNEAVRSVTRLGEFSPLWKYFKTIGQFCNGLFIVWQNFEPTLAIFYANGSVSLLLMAQNEQII